MTLINEVMRTYGINSSAVIISIIVLIAVSETFLTSYKLGV